MEVGRLMDTSLRTEKRAQKKKEKKYAHNLRTLAHVNVLSGKKIVHRLDGIRRAASA